MCGLIYYKSFVGKPIGTEVEVAFKFQKERGTEGFGWMDVDRGWIYKFEHEEEAMVALNRKIEKNSTEMLFHHRNPTSTDNRLSAAHPFTTGNFFKHNYVLAHNGIIGNSSELREKHKKLGIVYRSVQKDGRFCDSEALLWEVALVMERRQKELETKGGAAFIFIKSRIYEKTMRNGRKKNEVQPISLNFARNPSNPLKMIYNDEQMILKSTARYGYGKESANDVTPHMLHTFNYKSKTLTMRPMEVPIRDWQAETRVTPSKNTPRLFTPRHNPQGRWDDETDFSYPGGGGWVRERGRHIYAPGRKLLDKGDTTPKHIRIETPRLPKRSMPQDSMLDLTGIQQSANEMLSKYWVKYDKFEEILWRVTRDQDRAEQATSQLMQQAKQQGGLKPKSIRKYEKYFYLMAVAIRAENMLRATTKSGSGSDWAKAALEEKVDD